MSQEFEITEIYSIGTNKYVDKIVCEIDEDGIIINPPLVHLLQENDEAKLLGQEESTMTILKPSAIALAKKILEFYEIE
jgi:hypothetical protein